MRKYFRIVHSLHKYTGIFISPFLLIFGLAVLVFNHQDLINRIAAVETLPVVKSKLDNISYEGPELEVAKSIISKLDIDGEIDFISRNRNSISFPVRKPGVQTLVRVDIKTGSVRITTKDEGFLRSLSFLHSMPGPHNIRFRGNSGFMVIWRLFTDMVVYLVLFLSVSGVFLWYYIKSERMPGVFALVAGILFFSGIFIIFF